MANSEKRRAGDILRNARNVSAEKANQVVDFFMSPQSRETVGKLDDQYSQGIMDMYLGPKDKPREFVDNPALGAAAATAGAYLGGTPLSYRGKEGYLPGAAYTSAAVKYGAVPLGAAAALHGGAQIVGGTTNAIFGGPEDGQQPGQLDLGSLTVSSLVGAGIGEVGIAGTNLYRNAAGIAPMAPGAKRRLGIAALGAGGSVLADALGQILFK